MEETDKIRPAGWCFIEQTPEGFETICNGCDFRRVVKTETAADWIAFCHSRDFRKRGCK